MTSERFTMRVFRRGQTHPAALATYHKSGLADFAYLRGFYDNDSDLWYRIIDNETGRNAA